MVIFSGGEICNIDGVRVDFEDGFGLARASNTTPTVILRFEADTEPALRRIQNLYREQILALRPELTLSFLSALWAVSSLALATADQGFVTR